MSDSREELNQRGFVRVPGIFTPEQIAELRVVHDNLFSMPASYDGDLDGQGKIGSIRFDVCARNEGLHWLLVHPPMLDVLRSLLGDDFVFLPEMAAHAGGFGDWHKDTTSQERAGNKFHSEDDFRMIQVAVYLQDNGEYGGGLDVIPGSHNLADRYLSRTDPSLANRIRRRVTKQLGLDRGPEDAISIPSQAGDLVCFDVRLDHKASWPLSRKQTPSKVKYAIFFMASANNAHARKYVEYIQSRDDYTYLKGHEYPKDLLELASGHGVNLMQTTRGELAGS